MNDEVLKRAKRTEPWIPVGHPDFKWTTGADVQATWRKHGWTPPSERMPAPPPEVKPDTTVRTFRVFRG